MDYLQAYLLHIFMVEVPTTNTPYICHNCCIQYNWNSLSTLYYLRNILYTSNDPLFDNAPRNQFFYILSKDIN